MPPSPVPAAVPPAGGTLPACASAVIDTNVWLDLYWFADPAARLLRAALDEGRLVALYSAAIDAELLAVLARPLFRVPGRDMQAALAAWRSCARASEAAQAAPWSCRDPDDQKFLDLAFGARAQWLLTKDRALLAVAKKARAAGLRITDPRGFATI